MTFEDAVAFHGHACPGLAFGYRVAKLALQELGGRAKDEELVAVVENNSCAVDAIQLICGCTFGKGNLIFRDYGKQVYTFFKRPNPEAVRIAVKWEGPPEDPDTAAIWKKYMDGDRSPEITSVIQDKKARKMQAILSADDSELFEIKKVDAEIPQAASIFQTLTCDKCGEKVMEPCTRTIDGQVLCTPCSEEKK